MNFIKRRFQWLRSRWFASQSEPVAKTGQPNIEIRRAPGEEPSNRIPAASQFAVGNASNPGHKSDTGHTSASSDAMKSDPLSDHKNVAPPRSEWS